MLVQVIDNGPKLRASLLRGAAVPTYYSLGTKRFTISHFLPLYEMGYRVSVG